MNFLLIQIALGIAVLNWIAVAKKWIWLVYVSKPATMMTLIAFVWGFRPGLTFFDDPNWLIFALFFSLAGDIFLMLEGNLLIPGLVSFLLAHVAYIMALWISLPPLGLASLLVILMVALTGLQIYRHIADALDRSDEKGMKFPVLLYIIVISVMLIFALLTLVSSGWENYRALLLSAGALLFFISDTWLAWDRFVEPLKLRDLRVMISYHLAQIFLCLGFLVFV